MYFPNSLKTKLLITKIWRENQKKKNKHLGYTQYLQYCIFILTLNIIVREHAVYDLYKMKWKPTGFK